MIKDFDPAEYDTPEVARLRAHLPQWRESVRQANDQRAILNRYIMQCRDAGISFERLRAITGMGMGTLQELERKAQGKPPRTKKNPEGEKC
jgi:hypothetical protein